MKYSGGKNGPGVFQQIISQMPPHSTYIELYLGSGGVLRKKRPAKQTFGVEIDAAVIAEYWNGREIPNFHIENRPALDFLNSKRAQPFFCPIQKSDTLIYVDPPYLGTVRRSCRPIYKHELIREDQHVELLRRLKQLNCNVMISGYNSELYNLELAGWQKHSFGSSNRAGQTIEVVWMNYPAPLELHDYRYLGSGFRQREKIKRQRDGFRKRFKKMSHLHRQAILSALEEFRQ